MPLLVLVREFFFMNKIQELQTLVTESQANERRVWEMFNEVADIEGAIY